MEASFLSVTLGVVIVAVLGLIYRWLTKDRNFFLEKSIPSMDCKPLLGSLGPLILKRVTFYEFVQQIYDKFSDAKVFGLFFTMSRTFVIRDPELIKQIAVKDFEYFTDRRTLFGDENNDNPNLLFAKALGNLKGQKWRNMRATLSPAFTGSRMRQMFCLMERYAEQMIAAVDRESAATGSVDYEMRDFCTRVANDIIATCAFGLEVNSLDDRENEFYKMGSKMVNFQRPTVMMKIFLNMLCPKLAVKLGLDLIDYEQGQYFSKLIKATIEARETHGTVRPDIIHLLMQARKGKLKQSSNEAAEEKDTGFATVEESQIGREQIEGKLTEIELIAQCLLFFLAGFDTISSLMQFVAYELAINPEVQQKLYQEIANDNASTLTYETLQNSKYLDMVVSEGLRLWPPPATERICVRDYELKLENGHNFVIEKDCAVWFPVSAIHKDPQYFPNPNKFDPERFSQTNRNNINRDAYQPFGIGPRNCIGSRFALMELKTIIYKLVQNYRIERYERTQVPIQLVKGLTGIVTENGMYLRFRKR
ncbi:cytochrome P450 9e2-like [Uranotaenia lowii]|uniref:cytochrome P450 9e2-like n=1 Tax=Uranotaenia lowii TaxID=190385 RepID=UPI002478CA4A|nr:cytochrome P450 9e2-like [Uranotaenia lowii]